MNWSLRIIVTFLLLVSNSVYAQSNETRRLIKEITQTIKKKSVVSNNVNWQKLGLELKSISYTGKHKIDKEQVYAKFIEALNLAGDKHSLFITHEITREINENQASNLYATSRYLGNRIAYLKIPYCFTFDINKDLKFTDTIISQIRELDKDTIDKWVIDLRGNKGGNVWPMITGLTPIIGDGVLGYTIHNKSNTEHKILNGKSVSFHYISPIYKTQQKFKKLAVLIDHQTASSGEMLAIFLLGFDNTKSFGSTSRGLTTVNSTYTFYDGSTIYLSSSYMADRNRKIYKNAITPSILFQSETPEDNNLQHVINWLLE